MWAGGDSLSRDRSEAPAIGRGGRMVGTSGATEWPRTEVVDALVPAVVAGLTEVAGGVPSPPAAILGRLGVPVDPAEERERILHNIPTNDYVRPEGAHEGQSNVANALDRLPMRLVERVLGALELRVASLILDPPPPSAVLAELAGPPTP